MLPEPSCPGNPAWWSGAPGNIPKMLCRAQATGKWPTTFGGNSIPCRTLDLHCPKIYPGRRLYLTKRRPETH